MKTKSKLLPLFALFALALFVGVASATVDFTSPTGATQDVAHGSQATISFDVQSTVLTGDFTDASLVLPNVFGSGTVWSGDTGTFTLNHDSSVPRSVTINVPAGQAPGVYTGQISFDGTYSLGGSPVVNPLPISLTVLSDSELTVTVKTPMTATQDAVVEVKNTGNVALSGIDMTKVSGGFEVTFSDDDFSLAVGAKKEVTVSAVSLGSIGFEGKSVVVKAQASDGTSDQVTLNVAGSFCEVSEGTSHGYLEISDIKVDNNGAGEDDEWKLLDEIEVTVEVSFEGLDKDDDAQDITVVLGLYDSDGKNQIDEMKFDDDDEEEKELGDLDDGEEEEVTFKFRVPADFEDGNYKLVVKAYSDDVSVEGIEDSFEECVDTAGDFDGDSGRYMAIDVQREDDEGRFIAFDDFSVSPSEASCGERVVLTFNVYNIGDEEQDQVKVNLRNVELGIDQSFEIRENMDEGDKESVSFEFIVPADARDALYTLSISADYDYKRGDYKQSLDEDESFQFRLLGCGSGHNPSTGFVSITASDVSVDAGEQVTVSAVIRNTGSSAGTFILDATGFQGWAVLDSISERIVELGAGESKEVKFTLSIDADASGEESFVVEVLSGDSTESEQVFVDIREGTSATGFGGLGDSAYLWIIGAVNVILVVLIIVVAVRIARR